MREEKDDTAEEKWDGESECRFRLKVTGRTILPHQYSPLIGLRMRISCTLVIAVANEF